MILDYNLSVYYTFYYRICSPVKCKEFAPRAAPDSPALSNPEGI